MQTASSVPLRTSRFFCFTSVMYKFSSIGQQAAGTLSYLRTSALPQYKIDLSPDRDDTLLDLSEHFVHSLEWLMLAQAQECWWQNAKLSNYKNTLLAKLAAQTEILYRSAMNTIRNASPAIAQVFPLGWVSHIEAKMYHFEAVSQYRQSVAELEASKYGVELARLDRAKMAAKQAYDIARRGRASASVMQDAQSLLDAVQKDFTRAERDNDLIYHEDIPPSSALPAIVPSDIAKLTIVPGLSNPTSLIGNEGPLFGALMSWGARAAIDIYEDRKDNLVKEQILDGAQRLKDLADDFLQQRNLPSALEAIERTSGLPSSVLQKAEDIRREGGPARIESSLEDVHRLAQQDADILNDAMDILDNEASEDETMRESGDIDRLPSHVANADLISKERRYRDILSRASDSDETVREKWDEWEANIMLLAGDPAELEAAVPSTKPSNSRRGSEGPAMQQHARALRVALEALDSLHRSLDDFVARAQSLAKADNIHNRIASVASGLEKLAEVKPDMFEEVMDQELSKYDKFLQELERAGEKQKGLLRTIDSSNEKFVESRRDDPAVRAREEALRVLELGYHKYREIVKNLNEGIQFYNDLAQIFTDFKATCKNWSAQRSAEIQAALVVAMEQSTLEASPPPQPPIEPTRPVKRGIGLPALTSDDWGFEEVSLPPAPR
ncbi:unnamed protein product [Mycena citricolor]|uniref:BRO1 domain-containing protein n=1 Tax=Mycena citricolor TaxID=2018698 RepID=A0AAD2Q2E4_9AGAR|nr:unnamed protein product [Mycena citricolor]